MADLIDVENALVALAVQVLYPNGTAQQNSTAGMPVKVYPGWPQANQLDQDLKVGICHVTVFPTAIERNVTRYPKEWQPLEQHPETITMTVSGRTITVAGSIPSPFYAQNVAVLANNLVFVYATQQGDTMTGIASALANQIAQAIPGATSSGAVITLPATANLQEARVGAAGTAVREIRRTERVFMITAWCDTPSHRDALCAALDGNFALTERLFMPDQMAARMIYRNSPVFDANQKSLLYRRDLNYSVEFATTQTSDQAQTSSSGSQGGISESEKIGITTPIVAVPITVAVQPQGATAPIATFTINS